MDSLCRVLLKCPLCGKEDILTYKDKGRPYQTEVTCDTGCMGKFIMVVHNANHVELMIIKRIV